MKKIEIRKQTRDPNSKYTYKFYYALVDDEDYDWLRAYKWYYRDGYAVTRMGRSFYGMHRMVARVMKGDPIYIDHIDNNPLNNQKSNLRKANRFQNQQNRKTNKKNKLPKGIRQLPSGKYNVRVQSFNERQVIGTFDTLEEAISARNRVAKARHGEFFNPSYKLGRGIKRT